MPDLTHRPTRYTTALVVAAALIAGAVGEYDLRFGPDTETVALKAENRALQLRAERLSAPSRQAHPTDPTTDLDSIGRRVRVPATTASAARNGSRIVKEDAGAGPREGSVTAALVRPAALTPATSGPGRSTADCARYPNQEAAQAVFLRDRRGLAAMDGDRDGKACEQLRSATAPTRTRIIVERAAPPAAPRPTPVPDAPPTLPAAPSKREILASGKHFGLATATEEEFSRIEGTLGRQASMEGFFKGFDTAYDRGRVTAAWANGRIPVMTWESRPLVDPTDPTDYSLSRIISGAFDDYLLSYAREVTSLGLPVIIRFDHEMNGNWNRWSEFESRNGVKKGEYVAAWRHVHSIFASQGANDQVIWLWSPNRIDNIGRYAPITDYWPGAAYVDQVGMTGYLRQEDRPPFTFDGTYTKTLAALRTLAPDKPLLLAEVGATEDGGRKAAWLRTFFPGLAANPDIAGFVWFNYAISDGGHTDDWRLNSTSAAHGEFKAGLASIGYGVEVGKRLTLQPRARSAITAGLAGAGGASATPVTPPPAPPAASTTGVR